MSDKIVIVVVELIHREAQITMMKENEQRFGTRDQHVAAYVEFTTIDEQRIVDILLNDTAEWLRDAESSLLTVFGELELLLERFWTSD